MNGLRSLLALALVLILSTSADAADNAKKKKAGKPVQGTVVDIKKDDNKESGSLVVKVIVGKKADGNTAEKTYKVTEATKVEKVAGKVKKGTPAVAGTAAKFGEVAKGGNIVLTAKGDEITEIKIVAGKKKVK